MVPGAERPETPAQPRSWAIPIAAVWGAAILYVVAQAVVILQTGEGASRVTAAAVEQIVLLLCWCAATPAILWSARRFPLDRRRWIRHGLLHLLFAAVFILAINILSPLVARLLLGEPLQLGRTTRYGLLTFLALFHLALVVYAFILGVGHHLQTLDARRAEVLRAERLRADLAEAQLRALQLQLQPHFLFNALNAVGSLILTGRGPEAFDVIGRLGELLRALLATESRMEVSLREELDLAEAYVAIERVRFGDRLRVVWEIAPDVAGARVPPMLLQPLVENAIRHGIGRTPEGGRVIVRASRESSRLRLEVCDDGPGPPGQASGERGIGLENTRRRLEHLYGTEQRLELRRAGEWTRALVELPFHTERLGGEAAA
jgi:sensor histidine kinase YesM